MPTIELSVDQNTNIITKALYYLFISAIYFTGVGIIAATGLFLVILGIFALSIAGSDSSRLSIGLGIIAFGIIAFLGPYLYFYFKLEKMQSNLRPGSKNIQLSDLENRISILINDKQYEQAIDKINEILSFKITFRVKGHFKFMKGLLLLELNRLEESRTTWDDLETDLLKKEQLEVFFKHYPELKKNQIKLLLEKQKPESALKIVNKVIAKTTNSVSLLILKGIIELELQKTNQAHKTLKKGLKKKDITQEEQKTINNLLTQPYRPMSNAKTT